VFSHTNDNTTAGIAVTRGNQTGQGYNSSAYFVGLALGTFDDDTLVHELGHLQVCVCCCCGERMPCYIALGACDDDMFMHELGYLQVWLRCSFNFMCGDIHVCMYAG
jgi:hypothetical protein